MVNINKINNIIHHISEIKKILNKPTEKKEDLNKMTIIWRKTEWEVNGFIANEAEHRTPFESDKINKLVLLISNMKKYMGFNEDILIKTANNIHSGYYLGFVRYCKYNDFESDFILDQEFWKHIDIKFITIKGNNYIQIC